MRVLLRKPSTEALGHLASSWGRRGIKTRPLPRAVEDRRHQVDPRAPVALPTQDHAGDITPPCRATSKRRMSHLPAPWQEQFETRGPLTPSALTMQSCATSCAACAALPAVPLQQCQPRRAPCPQPRQALLLHAAAGTCSSANIPFPTDPSTMSPPATPQDQKDRQETHARTRLGYGHPCQDGRCSPTGVSAFSSSFSWPAPQLSPPPQPGLHTPPIFLWSEAFHCTLRTKAKNGKVPQHQTKQLLIKSPFWSSQKSQLGSAPLHITPYSKSSTQVVPRTTSPGGTPVTSNRFPTTSATSLHPG